MLCFVGLGCSVSCCYKFGRAVLCCRVLLRCTAKCCAVKRFCASCCVAMYYFALHCVASRLETWRFIFMSCRVRPSLLQLRRVESSLYVALICVMYCCVVFRSEMRRYFAWQCILCCTAFFIFKYTCLFFLYSKKGVQNDQ